MHQALNKSKLLFFWILCDVCGIYQLSETCSLLWVFFLILKKKKKSVFTSL